MSANATALTRWEKSVNPDLFLSVPFALVANALVKESERSVRDGLGELVISNHSTNVQVFHVDHIEAFNNVGGNFVDMVGTTIRDFLLNLCHNFTLLFPSITSIFLSGKFPLGFSQLLSVLGSILWVSNSFTVAQCSETVDSEINTNGFSGLLKRPDFFVKYESNEVVTNTRLGYRHSGRTTCKLSTPTNIKLAEFSNGESLTFLAVLKCRGGVLGGLTAMFLFEGWVLCPPVKKVIVRFLKVAKNLLGWHARNVIQPCVRLFLLQSGKFGTGLIVVDLDTFVILVRPITEHVIIDVAASAKRFS